MKKIVLVVMLVGTILNLVSCDEAHTPLDCPEVFEAGQQDAVKKIRKEAENDWERYVEIEELEEIISRYFGDESDEIRDMLIYNPDLERYDTFDIVEGVIEETGVYYYDSSFED